MRRVSFKRAVRRIPQVRDAHRPGLQALRAEDRPHVKAQNPRQLTGSVDIDQALETMDPHGHRWDYAIAYKHSNRAGEVVYWLELHTATDSQVNIVIEKAKWLLNWLRDAGRPLALFERDIVWLSSGATSFTLTAPQRKQMAQVGLMHRGRFLHISERREA
jgi:hypothetical protein